MSRRTWLVAALATAAALAVGTRPGRADTYIEYLTNKADYRESSKFLIMQNPQNRDAIQRAEDVTIDKEWQLYLTENHVALAIGQPAFNNEYPVSHYDDGVTGTLTFQFIDPTTGLPTTGPAVASVLYEVNDDPDNSVYTTLGTSTDAATNFSLSYTVEGFEPDVQAIPYDANGDPIFIPGFDGSNVAVGSVAMLVPEPSALALLGLGTAAVTAFAASRARGRRATAHSPGCRRSPTHQAARDL